MDDSEIANFLVRMETDRPFLIMCGRFSLVSAFIKQKVFEGAGVSSRLGRVLLKDCYLLERKADHWLLKGREELEAIIPGIAAGFKVDRVYKKE